MLKCASEFQEPRLPGRQLYKRILNTREDRVGGASSDCGKFPMGHRNYGSGDPKAGEQFIDQFPAGSPTLPRKMVCPVRLSLDQSADTSGQMRYVRGRSELIAC